MKFAIHYALVGIVWMGLFPAQARGDVPVENPHTLVWLCTEKTSSRNTVKAAKEALSAIDVVVICDKRLAPNMSNALEAMAAYRAMAVAWHDETGALHLLIAQDSAQNETLTANHGSAQAEALYVREVLEARMDSELMNMLLVTVPARVSTGASSNGGTQKQLPVSSPSTDNELPVDGAQKNNADLPPNGIWIGLGYLFRSHFDATTWAQHGISFNAPSIRISSECTIHLISSLSFPSRIGRPPNEEWIEVGTFGETFGVTWHPVHSKKIELEFGGGMGVEQVSATHFTTIENYTKKHVQAVAQIWLAFSWYLTNAVALRFHLDGVIAFPTPSFNIDNVGDFGHFPWQPGAGIDIIVWIFGSR